MERKIETIANYWGYIHRKVRPKQPSGCHFDTARPAKKEASGQTELARDEAETLTQRVQCRFKSFLTTWRVRGT